MLVFVACLISHTHVTTLRTYIPQPASSASPVAVATGIPSPAIVPPPLAASSSPALRLFPSQYQAILANPATRNPLFLRLLLQALRWSARRHFDLWRLLPLWLEARSVVELYHRVLETWERGLAVSPATTADALARARREGGHDALRWEQRRQPRRLHGNSSGGGGNSPSLLAPAALEDAADPAAGGQSSAQQAKEVAGELPFAEIQWRKVHADADKVRSDEGRMESPDCLHRGSHSSSIPLPFHGRRSRTRAPPSSAPPRGPWRRAWRRLPSSTRRLLPRPRPRAPSSGTSPWWNSSPAATPGRRRIGGRP